ncbi:DUF4843 domain-containing protein [Pedobacter sp. V48]|uniref:DUF4843 domain-containing protein n=1 Tax=Pedobacter sp. V48 TaxID=509635 RepID=UPI0003E58D88|nr:DUF4843 domain-containing protein [Pedobacter sp. V48]ETZ22347.1 hypothetical protein N824_01500 [Pedobacter sp. V48]
MRTIKSYFIIILALLSITSCKKAEEMVFSNEANVYFDIYNGDKDSLVRTFAYTPNKAQDTLYLPVRLSGIRTSVARTYHVRVESDSSTAIPEQHYQPLKSTYTMPADAGTAYIPVIMYNKDKALEEKSVSIIIKLIASDDFGVSNPTMLRAKVVFSAKLEKPDWWDTWLTNYSRTKHELFYITTGQTSMTTGSQGGLDAPKNLYYTGLLTIMMNNPFNWVTKNVTKGYVLQEVTAGNSDSYYFFNTGNPSKKTLLRKNTQTGKYYFIDENGKEVI